MMADIVETETVGQQTGKERTAFQIPPTGVGGLFRSNLPELALDLNESHQRQLVDCSDPTCWSKSERRKTTNRFLNALGRFASKAGSEQSTNFRWWDSITRPALACRLDVNNPPTAVGGIQKLTYRCL
jgi:hypothetical protein